MANLRHKAIYEFENFRLDAAHLMLYQNEREISLAPKVIETLLALVERRGEVLGKDELMKLVWTDSIVEEGNLTQNLYLNNFSFHFESP
jgi:DNA-binding winged helix-turn-helix (wHTH) protein